MDRDDLVYRVLPRLAVPLLAAALFGLLWWATGRLTRRTALRAGLAVVGTLLVLAAAFLWLWGQASGS